jgi:amino acid transporter
MALAIVATVNATITIGPRVYYAMAKDSAFLTVTARVSPRLRVPIAAVVFQGVCATLMTSRHSAARHWTLASASRSSRCRLFAGSRVNVVNRGVSSSVLRRCRRSGT